MPTFFECCTPKSQRALLKWMLRAGNIDWRPPRTLYRKVQVNGKIESLEDIDRIMRQSPRRIRD